MEMMKLGPLGDSSGKTWEEMGSESISHILVSFNDRYLTSVQFGYVKKGALVMSKKHGSSNGDSTRIVRLNHVSEFVTGISGECWGGNIASLTFHTNQRTHEAFRATCNPMFRPKLTKREFHSGMLDRREFAGFFGSCSSFRLNSIGLYLKPILTGIYIYASSQEQIILRLSTKREYSEMLKVGPIGSTRSSDESWDEKGQNMISDIYVTFDDYGIKSIQFIYFQEGAHVESQKHGYSGGQHIKRVRLENDEYLTALSGVFYIWISSLTFHTNKRKYGLFCKRYDSYKKTEMDVGMIRDRSEFGGLFGSFSVYGGYLASIGMYVSHNTSSIDAVPRTMLGATYDNQFIRYQSLDPTTTRLDYDQDPKIVDGFPVKTSRRYKPKLKDRILSKLDKAIRFLIKL